MTNITPKSFTGLVDMFVLVLATLPTINDIERKELPRMADFYAIRVKPLPVCKVKP